MDKLRKLANRLHTSHRKIYGGHPHSLRFCPEEADFMVRAAKYQELSDMRAAVAAKHQENFRLLMTQGKEADWLGFWAGVFQIPVRYLRGLSARPLHEQGKALLSAAGPGPYHCPDCGAEYEFYHPPCKKGPYVYSVPTQHTGMWPLGLALLPPMHAL
jgi:hypothetical protein